MRRKNSKKREKSVDVKQCHRMIRPSIHIKIVKGANKTIEGRMDVYDLDVVFFINIWEVSLCGCRSLRSLALSSNALKSVGSSHFGALEDCWMGTNYTSLQKLRIHDSNDLGANT